MINIHVRWGLLVLCGIVAPALRAEMEQGPHAQVPQGSAAPVRQALLPQPA